MALFFGQGVFGFGLFWPTLLVLEIGPWVYWVGMVTGLFLGTYYSMNTGLMSLYILVVLFLWQTVFGGERLKPLWLSVVSVTANLVFDLVFGFGLSIVDTLFVLFVSLLLARSMDGTRTIKVNL